MAYEVRTETASERRLAAIRATAPRGQLGEEIRRLLDAVWPVLREQRVRTDHNIVVYHGGNRRTLDLEAGVETLSEFEERGEVRRSATPAGEVATTAHHGDYSELSGAYAALGQWCAEHGRRPSGIGWEVYGDWSEDPAKLRTDVYILLEPHE